MKFEDFDNAAPALQALRERHSSLPDLLDVEIAAAGSLGNEALVREAEKLKNHFSYMLKYLVSNDIPDIISTTDELLLQGRRLQRRILREYNVAHSSRSYYASVRFQRLRPEENLESLISDYLSELERRSNDPTTMMSNKANERLEELSGYIFEHIRTVFNFKDHTDLIANLILDPAIPRPDRVLWLGAIGIGQFEVYDENRTDFLLDVLAKGDTDVKVGAAVWLVLEKEALRLDFGVSSNYYSTVARKIDRHPARDIFIEAWFEILKLYAFSILEPAQKEKIIPSLESMLRNMNVSGDPASMNEMLRNPESMASSAQAFEWVRRFNEAIREGFDVQADSLGRLRHWPFFGKLANWLLPFDPNHSALAGIADEDGAPVADMLTKMGTIIDSDKYALILSLSNLPASMRESAIQGTMNQMGADSDEFIEALNDEAKEAAKLRSRINNYAKQVWRVLTSFPKKDDIYNHLDLNSLTHADNFSLSNDQYRRFGEMLLRLKDAGGALRFFENIQDPTDEDNRNLARISIILGKDDFRFVDYIRSNPGDIDLLMECVQLGRFSNELYEAFKYSEMMENENIPFLSAYVKVLEDKKSYGEAADKLMALEYLDSYNARKHRTHRGFNLIHAGLWSDALEALEGAELNDRDTVAALAVAFWMTGKRSEALRLLEKNKNLSELSYSLAAFTDADKRIDAGQRAMLHYLLDSWQYILNDSNPLNI